MTLYFYHLYFFSVLYLEHDQPTENFIVSEDKVPPSVFIDYVKSMCLKTTTTTPELVELYEKTKEQLKTLKPEVVRAMYDVEGYLQAVAAFKLQSKITRNAVHGGVNPVSWDAISIFVKRFNRYFEKIKELCPTISEEQQIILTIYVRKAVDSNELEDSYFNSLELKVKEFLESSQDNAQYLVMDIIHFIKQERKGRNK